MNEQTTTARTALKWGAITGLAQIVYSTILYTFDLTTNPGLGILIYLILIIGLVLGMRAYRTANEGYMTYGEGLGLGTLLSAISGLLSSAFSIFYTTVIDPEFQARLFEKIREQMEERGNMTDEQIDQAMEISQKFQSPGLQFIFGILWLTFIGFVCSLVIAAILRRNKTSPF